MLTTRIRKQIEWHFHNHNADIALYNERARDIIDTGLTARLDRIGGDNGIPGRPTESKAIKIEAFTHEKNWAAVIRNTFNAFRFEPEYELMVNLYIDRKKPKELLMDSGMWERTYLRWRDNWLEYAYNWAKEFRLL